MRTCAAIVLPLSAHCQRHHLLDVVCAVDVHVVAVIFGLATIVRSLVMMITVNWLAGVMMALQAFQSLLTACGNSRARHHQH